MSQAEWRPMRHIGQASGVLLRRPQVSPTYLNAVWKARVQSLGSLRKLSVLHGWSSSSHDLHVHSGPSDGRCDERGDEDPS